MMQVPQSQRGLRLSRQPVRSRRDLILGRLALLALVPCLAFAIYTMVDKSLQAYRLRHDELVVRAEVEAEKQENLRLQRQLGEARSDQGIEDSARRYLNLVKPGDNAIVLTGAAPRPTPTPPPPRPPSFDETFPDWLTWLLNRYGR